MKSQKLIIDKEQFLLNLRITQAYCERQLKQAEHSPGLVLRSLVNDYQNGFCPDNDEVFTKLFEQQLRLKESLLDAGPEPGARGKILVIEHGLNIPDGAAQIESAWFIDEFDLPPIDTWFYKAQDDFNGTVLFAWIPEKFVRFANEAIAVHFLDILSWFDDWKPYPISWIGE